MIKFKRDKSFFIGDFYQGLKHGKGKITYVTGDSLESTWKYNTRENRGILVLQDTIYDGELGKRGQPEGEGSREGKDG